MSFCLHSLNKVLISELFGGFCDSTDEPWLQFFVLIEANRPLDVTIAEYLARCEYFHPSHLKEWRANTENLHDFSFFIRVLISSWRLQRSTTLFKPAAVSQSLYQAEYFYSFISRSLFCLARVSHTRQRFLLAPFSLLGQSNCSGKKG